MSPRAQTRQHWVHQLQQLLPIVRTTQVTPLALLSLGIAWATSVTLLKVATSLPLPATAPSTERRLRRWLANPRVDPAQLWPPLARMLLASRASAPLELVLDPTPLGAHTTILFLGVVVQRRVLPLAWQCGGWRSWGWQRSTKASGGSSTAAIGGS